MKTHCTIIIITLLGLFGCASIDSSRVRARAGAPESARVERIEIPYDESLPKYALVVETFVAEGPVNETKIRTHHVAEQHGRESSRVDTAGTFSGTARDTVRDREKETVESQNKALTLRQTTDEATNANHPMIRNVSASTDSFEPVEAARSKTTSTTQRDRMYNRDLEGELSRRSTTNNSGQNHLTQHTDGAVDITQRSWEVSRRDINIAAQFTSSLAGVENFVLLTPAAAKPLGAGKYQADLPQGAVGPFVVKALVTEEVHEVEGGQSRIFVPGVIASKSSELQGVVVMDITVLDGRTGALVAAFPTEGTFISQDKRFSAGVLLPLAEQHAFARSVVSQAQRVALNQAAVKILDAFRNYRG